MAINEKSIVRDLDPGAGNYEIRCYNRRIELLAFPKNELRFSCLRCILPLLYLVRQF